PGRVRLRGIREEDVHGNRAWPDAAFFVCVQCGTLQAASQRVLAALVFERRREDRDVARVAGRCRRIEIPRGWSLRGHSDLGRCRLLMAGRLRWRSGWWRRWRRGSNRCGSESRRTTRLAWQRVCECSDVGIPRLLARPADAVV